ncbi:MAG TPA: MmgE/PrpD family protein [Paenalcaligenes sp.]|nr:MmgE/PrpD family protein [Paenalcaligenes sp.]
MNTTHSTAQSAQLAQFIADLRYEDIPTEVVRRTEDLLLDWFGSALAGKGARPVESIARFARRMAGGPGRAEVLISREHSTPLFAAMVNAAASHFIEQDDVHNASVFHPAAVIFPPVLAVAQDLGCTGEEIILASVAGYEVGIRIGEYLGRNHYTIFHTTGTVGTVAAAAAVAKLLRLDATQCLDAIGSAGTQAAGLWEFLRDAADSKQLHTAHAASAGLMAAYLAKDGFKGAQHILEGPQGMAAGMTNESFPEKLCADLGTRWATLEVSFKFHASCRHTHPAADALLKAMQDNQLKAADIERVDAYVHQGAIDVLGPVVDPQTVHQAKFSMGTVLGLIATRGGASVVDFEEAAFTDDVIDVRNRVHMHLDEEVDGAYPKQWIGKVTVTTRDGNTYDAKVLEPKGDPGNTLSRAEIEEKVHILASFTQAATAAEVDQAIEKIWHLTKSSQFNGFF